MDWQEEMGVGQDYSVAKTLFWSDPNINRMENCLPDNLHESAGRQILFWERGDPTR